MTSVKVMIQARVDFAKNKLGLIGKMVKDDVLKSKGKSPLTTGSMIRSRREFLEARNARTLEINSAMMEKGRKVTKGLLAKSVANVAKDNQSAVEFAM